MISKIQKHFVLLMAIITLAGCATVRVPQTRAEVADDLLLQVEPSRAKVYSDEMIVLRYNVLTRLDTRYEGFEEEGRFPEFWIQDFPITNIKRGVVTVNGKKYIKAEIRKRMIFPMQKGIHTVQPGEAKFNVGKNISMSIKTKPVEIEVKDFPDSGKPKEFAGSTGIYAINYSIKKTDVDGEYILIVTIEGNGNLWGLKLPPINFGSDFELLHKSQDIITNLDTEKEIVSGRKRFLFTLAAKKKGDIKLNQINFAFFNSKEGAYKIINIPPISVQVEKVYDFSKGIQLGKQRVKTSLMILMDYSGSMTALDINDKDRLTGAKNLVKNILKKQSGDQEVGIKAFSREVETILTLSRMDSNINLKINKIFVDQKRDGTALGSAIYEGVQDLVDNGKGRNQKIILITDGSYNTGYMDPLTAANFAAKNRIPITIIALGKDGKVPFPNPDLKSGSSTVDIEMKVDQATLQEIAKLTGGKYYRVEDESMMAAVLKNI